MKVGEDACLQTAAVLVSDPDPIPYPFNLQKSHYLHTEIKELNRVAISGSTAKLSGSNLRTVAQDVETLMSLEKTLKGCFKNQIITGDKFGNIPSYILWLEPIILSCLLDSHLYLHHVFFI